MTISIESVVSWREIICMREQYKVLAICLVTLTVFSGITVMFASMTPSTRLKFETLRFDSINWAGYAVYGSSGSVSDVMGEWVVPSVSSSGGQFSSAYSGFWVGIDGYNSPTVEQIGISANVGWFGITDYFAWYEMFPLPYVRISMAISPGDDMFAEVTYLGSGNFRLQIFDWTRGTSFWTIQTNTNAHRSSAEWIAEAPSSYGGVLPLANFGTVTFWNCYVTANNVVGSISGFVHDKINMLTSVPNGILKAAPSDLTNGGTRFTVTWYHS
jgi:hypothetical protein